MITDYEGDMPNLDVQVDGEIPIFVTRNLVMFPGILYPRWQKTNFGSCRALGGEPKHDYSNCKSER